MCCRCMLIYIFLFIHSSLFICFILCQRMRCRRDSFTCLLVCEFHQQKFQALVFVLKKVNKKKRKKTDSSLLFQHSSSFFSVVFSVVSPVRFDSFRWSSEVCMLAYSIISYRAQTRIQHEQNKIDLMKWIWKGRRRRSNKKKKYQLLNLLMQVQNYTVIAIWTKQ